MTDPRHWSDRELDIVRRYWSYWSDAEISTLLRDLGFDRTALAVSCVRRTRGWQKPTPLPSQPFEVPPRPAGDAEARDRRFVAMVWQEAERCGLIRRAA